MTLMTHRDKPTPALHQADRAVHQQDAVIHDEVVRQQQAWLQACLKVHPQPPEHTADHLKGSTQPGCPVGWVPQVQDHNDAR